jgi:hypothetical protein
MSLQFSLWSNHLIKFSYILLLTLACLSNVQAKKDKDVELVGRILIGDNDFEHIKPNFFLQANDSAVGSNLVNPKPLNPIHFNLSDDVKLKEIELKDTKKTIDGKLYFVIWNSVGAVVVNVRSDRKGKDKNKNNRVQFANPVLLPKGDYRIAIVGQCFDGNNALGWKSECQGFDYDDFEFNSIKFKFYSGDSKSIAFIQRRHLGNNNEILSNGYKDRWYPDYYEGEEIEYKFKVEKNTKFKLLTIYNYRDFFVNKNKITLELKPKHGPTITHTMKPSTRSGDYTWEFNSPLPKGDYALKIKTLRTLLIVDDVSWDDIVIKQKSDKEPTINHYRIDHPVNALTCQPATVTVKACTNNFSEGGTCSEASSPTSATLRARIKDTNNTVETIPARFTGTKDIALDYQQPNTLTLSLTNIGTKPYYCNNSAAGGCDITFADAGFLFSYYNANGSSDIAAQTSGVTFPKPIKLKAFYNEDGKCKNVFDGNQIVNVGLGIQCKDPGTCSGQNFRVDGKVIGQNAANEQTDYKPIALSFNKNSADITPAWFEDAGSINLIATYTIDDKGNDLDGLTINGQSNAFWVKPDKFTITATDKDDEGIPLNGSSATSKVIYSAAKPFTLKVTAVNRQGVATQNYQPTNSKSIQGKVTRIGPDSGGVDGIFQYANKKSVTAQLNTPKWSTLTGFTPFNSGSSEFADAKYNEVGIIKFDLRDKDYHGRPIEADGSGVTIGRFTPDHFQLVESSVTNYLAGPADVGVTYMSQPALVFNYKLQAQNLGGDPTRNYIGDYNKAEVAKLDEDKVGFVVESDGLEAGDRLADFLGNWCNGVYQSGSCTNYGSDTGLFSRLTTGPDGPFMNTYFGIKLEDTDKVKLNDLDMLPASSANSTAKRLSQKKSELRYGRWTIADGYGPINQPFPVSMQLEYFNGKEFVLNKDDSITAFSASAATATFNKKTLDLTGSGTFQDGFTQKLIINAHSHIGDVRLIHTAPVWLQYDWPGADDNPAAIISFGFFRGNDRVIYRRRVN